MSVTLAEEMDRKVVALGSFMSLSDAAIDQGRADAARIALAHHTLHSEDVWVSLSWQKRFPRRSAYGEAVNAALSVASATWRVVNRLGEATRSIGEAGIIARPLINDGLFIFMRITRQEVLSESIELTRARISEPENPVTVWDYLCFAASEPDTFDRKVCIAVGDTIPVSHLDECLAPTLLLSGARLELSSIRKRARPNGTPLHHMVARPLTI